MYCTILYKELEHPGILASTGASWNQPPDNTEGQLYLVKIKGCVIVEEKSGRLGYNSLDKSKGR